MRMRTNFLKFFVNSRTIGLKFEGIGAIFMGLQPIHLFLNRLLIPFHWVPMLFDKSIRIFGIKRIKRGASIKCETRLPIEHFPAVLFQFFGELSHVDPHKAGPFTRTAIGASAGTMIGAQNVKRSCIRGIITFTDPLGFGFIHKASRAIAKRAGIPAGITADAIG